MGQAFESESSTTEDDFYDFKIKYESLLYGPIGLQFIKFLDEDHALTLTALGTFQTWNIKTKKCIKKYGELRHYTDLVVNKKDNTLLSFHAVVHKIHKDKPRITNFSTLWKNVIQSDEKTHVAFHSIVWDWKEGKTIGEETLFDGYHSIFFWDDRIIGQRGVHNFQVIEIESGLEIVKNEIEHNFDSFIKLTTCGDYLVGNLENSDTILVWDKSFKLVYEWRADYDVSDIIGLSHNYILLGCFHKIWVMDMYSGKSKIIGEHGTNITCFAINDDTLLSGDEYGNIKVWEISKVIELFATEYLE
eukprot:gene8020-12485_t